MIAKNKIQCARCKSIIESRHEHDFVQCCCKAVAVDGGYSYLRRIGETEDIIELSEVTGGELTGLAPNNLGVYPSVERLRTLRSAGDPQ